MKKLLKWLYSLPIGDDKVPPEQKSSNRFGVAGMAVACLIAALYILDMTFSGHHSTTEETVYNLLVAVLLIGMGAVALTATIKMR